MTKYQVTWKTYQPKRYKVWGVAVVLALTLPTLLLANDARLGVESKHILERAAEPNSLEDTAGLLLENEVATSGEADLPRFDNRVEADLSNDITPELILHLDLLKDRLSVKSFLTYY